MPDDGPDGGPAGVVFHAAIVSPVRQGDLPGGLDVVGEPGVALLELGVLPGDLGVAVGVAEKAVGDAGQVVAAGDLVDQRAVGLGVR
jgi:hypothetical protein